MALLTMHSLCSKERSRMPGGTRQKKHFSACLYIFFRCIIRVDSAGNIYPDSSLAFLPTLLPPHERFNHQNCDENKRHTPLWGWNLCSRFLFCLLESAGFTSPFIYCYLLSIITLLLWELWGKYAPQRSPAPHRTERCPKPSREERPREMSIPVRRWMQEHI